MVRQGKRVGSGSGSEAELRGFLVALRDGAACPGPVPSVLMALARGVLADVPADRHVEPDDLVADLLERLNKAHQRHGVRVVDALLATDSVRSVLRERLRQIAVEYVPGRAARKELRVHVARALEATGSHAWAKRPDALEVDGRYRSAAVCQGVAWALHSEGVPPEVHAVEAFLSREFALGVTHVDSSSLEALPDDGALPAEAAVLLHALRAELGPDGTHLVGRHLEGATLQELCAETGRKQTALHAQVGRLRARLIGAVRNAEASVPQARGALRMLVRTASALGPSGVVPRLRPARRAARTVSSPRGTG